MYDLSSKIISLLFLYFFVPNAQNWVPRFVPNAHFWVPLFVPNAPFVVLRLTENRTFLMPNLFLMLIFGFPDLFLMLIFGFLGAREIAKLSPSPSSNWAVAGSIPSFSVRPAGCPASQQAGRPSGIVLSRHSMTLISKAKLLILMMRL